MKRTGPTNPDLMNLIKELKTASLKNDAPIWKRIATELEKPSRKRRHVNLYEINKHINDGDVVIIPGKVLATGDLTKRAKVVAWSFSEKAIEKIKETTTIHQLIKDNPKGSNVKIIC